VYPNGKIENTSILKEDIETNRNHQDIYQVFNNQQSYLSDRAELTFEKDVMILIEDEPSMDVDQEKSHSAKPSHRNKIERIKVIITKKEIKWPGIPLYYQQFEDSEDILKEYGKPRSKVDPCNNLYESLMKVGMYPISEDQGTFYYYA